MNDSLLAYYSRQVAQGRQHPYTVSLLSFLHLAEAESARILTIYQIFEEIQYKKKFNILSFFMIYYGSLFDNIFVLLGTKMSR